MSQLHLACRGFSCTESIRQSIERQTEKLSKHFERIQRCDVTIDLRHRHQRQGKIFHVQIHLSLPLGDIFVNREPEKDHAHESLAVAIRDAFATARRRLEDEVSARRDFVAIPAAREPVDIEEEDAAS